LGVINGRDFHGASERRKLNFVIVNTSKQHWVKGEDLVVFNKDGFAISQCLSTEVPDHVIGQYVGEIRFDSLMTFKAFSGLERL
jgi:hypothetical protein